MEPAAAALQCIGPRPDNFLLCTQVAYTRGQAPVTRAAAEDVSRAATWALLEPVGQPAELQVRLRSPMGFAVML